MLLGCIGDDFTGSSDLANTLAKQGMYTVLYSGIPNKPAATDVEAGIVALKSRSLPVEEAIRQSLDALNWLKAQGCKQFFFKYCSTFDSTQQGNIGPVTDALIDALGADRVVVCPAFPGTGRSVYQGHLFVNDVLLNESGMENHPLTPMTDPDIRRWLAQQSRYEIGHVPTQKVFAGSEAIRAGLDEQHAQGKRLIVVDAISDEDLIKIGQAVADLPLLTGGSGVAIGLPDNFRRNGGISQSKTSWNGSSGRCVALSGSCSKATRAQVELHSQTHPTWQIDLEEVMNGTLHAEKVTQWLLDQPGIPLVYSSADPEKVEAGQKNYGREASAHALENFFVEIARLVTASGVERLIVAGGETSGAVVEGLALDTMAIGPEIDPGVPAMWVNPHLVIALKSGNFGARDFFVKAARVMQAEEL